MDDDYKKLLKQLMEQQAAGGVQVDAPSVEEESIFEAPRPDYSVKQPQYSKISEQVSPVKRILAPSPVPEATEQIIEPNTQPNLNLDKDKVEAFRKSFIGKN